MNKIIVTLALFCLISASLIMFTPTTSSKVITVPDDYPTINSAIQKAVDGDTIFVKSGTYTEQLIIDKAITLKGEEIGTTIIDGNNTSTVILISHDNVEISDFTIRYDYTPNSPKSIWMWSTRLAGIHLLNVEFCKIHDNKVLDCGGGIWLYGASQNSIMNNYVYRNDYGIRVEGSTDNTFEGNIVTGNWGGMQFISSFNNRLKENVMQDNTENFAITGDEISYINNVDTTNKVDNKPIYYWIGLSHTTVPLDAGYVILVDCKEVNIEGLILSKNHDGIVIVNCLNTYISNNTITQTNNGITTLRSIKDNIEGNNLNCINAINVNGNGSTIINNKIIATNTGIGTAGSYHIIKSNTITITTWQGNMIKASGSYNSIIKNWLNGTSYTYSNVEGSNNLFYENTMANCYQLYVKSNESIIAKNTLTGISVSDSTGTSICGNIIINGLGLGVGGHNNFFYANQIEDNYYVGASISSAEASSGNIIYHNNFVNNKVQIKNIGKNECNFWDNGSEGNYWSDYLGTDLDVNNIGDTPYMIMTEALDYSAGKMVLTATGQDNHPLMTPYDTSSITIQLPQWTFTAPDTIEPLATPTKLPNETPTVKPTDTPVNNPILTPIQTTPTATLLPSLTSTYGTLTTVALAIVIGTGLWAYFKKTKR